jgi:hypothetical protein
LGEESGGGEEGVTWYELKHLYLDENKRVDLPEGTIVIDIPYGMRSGAEGKRLTPHGFIKCLVPVEGEEAKK